MKLTTVVQVRGETQALRSMMQDFNSACNWLSSIAFSERIFHWLPLQQRAYYEVRRRYGLTAASAAVAVRKVAYAYRNKARRSVLAAFRPFGGIPLYQHRYKRDGTVLIYGHRFPFLARPGVALSNKSQAVLAYRRGQFFIHQPLEALEPEPIEVGDFLGCDLGIVNILADSDGETYAGSHLNGLRKRHIRLRSRLQSKGTRSAKRLLRKRRLRERRFARDVNHVISKRVVAKAHDTLRGIALENLGGIMERITVRRAQRRQHHSWAFHQLRSFLEYKAALLGVPVAVVNPKNTSRTCPRCGLVDKANRKSQARFSCVRCAFSGPADVIAAENIRVLGRAAGFQPHAASRSIGTAAT